MRVLIIGCGYVGSEAGAELARQGHEVWGMRRSEAARAELEAVGIKWVKGDLSQLTELGGLPGSFDWIINTVSAGRSEPDAYRQTYLNGAQNLTQWLAANPPKKLVYTSSTNVYGQTDGSQVKEESSTIPPTETGKILLETEQVFLKAYREHKMPVVILRVAGIYGPDRGYWFQQYLANTAKIEGKGDRWLNMIHRDDVAGVLIAALKSGRPGEIYNAVDDEPVAQLHFFRWLSETLGKDMPPFDPDADRPERKRGWSNKKVQNRRLKMEIGYRFKYPTFRQGYTAEILRLQNAGKLD